MVSSEASKKTLLVIDDEEIVRITTQEMLKRLGYSVLVAKDGYEGVEIYSKESSRINGVLLDSKLPGMNGKETFVELKKINKDINVVLTTGLSEDEDSMELNSLGIKGILAKPYGLKNLDEKVKEMF